MSDGDSDDWKTQFIPGYQATPLSVNVLFALTAFAVQTALGVVVTDNLSFFLNRPTLTAIGAAVLLVPLLLWNALAVGRGIERKQWREQKEEKREEDEQEQEGPLTVKQQLEVENIVLRHLRRDRRQGSFLDEAFVAILSELIDSDTDVSDLEITDPEVRERVAEQQGELEQMKQSQITEEDVREIVAESLDGVADSQEVRQIADDIESRINELESRTEDNQKNINMSYKAVKREVAEFEATTAEEAERGKKNQEDAPQSQSQEADDREPEFEK